jgi:hypothetical protein
MIHNDNEKGKRETLNPNAPLGCAGRSYGKGLIQSVYELSDSSGLVLTVGNPKP